MPTTYNKATLATFFQTGDVPQGSDYENLIYSQVNVVETSTQSMAGALNPTELITGRVSAGNGNFTGIVSANSIQSNSLSVATNISAVGDIYGLNLYIGGITVVNSGTITAANVSATTVSAGTVYSTNGVISSVGIVSAAGTTQGTAASLSNIVNRGKGVVDGTTTGYTPLANRAGLVQYLYNEGASANLWPPTGGIINGLAVNAPFSLAASAMVTIVHLAASAYAVK